MKQLALALIITLIGLAARGSQPPPLPAPIAPATMPTLPDTTPTLPDTTATAASTNASPQDNADLEDLRDPFWPLGYIPAPPEPVLTPEEIAKGKLEQEVKKQLNWPTLQLKGITHASKGRFMAIIEEIGPVERDQIISLQRGNIIYSWQIEDVTEKGVVFKRLEARPAPSQHRWFRK